MQTLESFNGPKIPRYIEGTLAAGASKAIDAIFLRWYIVSATGVLTVKTNYSPNSDYSERSGEFADPSALYERLEIKNNTGAEITYKIFYGFGDFIDRRNENQGSVVVTGSALPTGAATSAKQDTGNTALANILAKIIAAPATEATSAAILAALASVAVTGPLTDAQLRATAVPVTRTKAGAQDNAWAAAAVGAGGTSASLDTGSLPTVSAFGNVDAATTITVQVSEDNATFYDTVSTVVLVGAGDFHISLTTAARYARLKSSGAATISATVIAKG